MTLHWCEVKVTQNHIRVEWISTVYEDKLDILSVFMGPGCKSNDSVCFKGNQGIKASKPDPTVELSLYRQNITSLTLPCTINTHISAESKTVFHMPNSHYIYCRFSQFWHSHVYIFFKFTFDILCKFIFDKIISTQGLWTHFYFFQNVQQKPDWYWTLGGKIKQQIISIIKYTPQN